MKPRFNPVIPHDSYVLPLNKHCDNCTSFYSKYRCICRKCYLSVIVFKKTRVKCSGRMINPEACMVIADDRCGISTKLLISEKLKINTKKG